MTFALRSNAWASKVAYRRCWSSLQFLFQTLDPLRHEIDLGPRHGNSAVRLLLKGVDDVDRLADLKDIDDAVGITTLPQYEFPDTPP